MPMTTSPTFTRPSEHKAYQLLHTDGLSALRNIFGTTIATDLINRWASAGMVRVSYPEGSMVIKTFKKYAKDVRS